jgi:hypothetical protein
MRAQKQPREMQPLSPNIASPQTSLAGEFEKDDHRLLPLYNDVYERFYKIRSALSWACSFVCNSAGVSFSFARVLKIESRVVNQFNSIFVIMRTQELCTIHNPKGDNLFVKFMLIVGHRVIVI